MYNVVVDNFRSLYNYEKQMETFNFVENGFLFITKLLVILLQETDKLN